jgi:hypothetical protein
MTPRVLMPWAMDMVDSEEKRNAVEVLPFT